MSRKQADSLDLLRSLHQQCDGGKSCITLSCRRRRCTVVLPYTPRLCIDCDRCDAFSARSADKKPDFVVLYATSQPPHVLQYDWLVIEMKTKTSHPGSIIDQLQSGAHVLQTDQRFELPTRSTVLSPIVLRSPGGGTHADDLRTLRAEFVSFFGRRSRVQFQQCGYDVSKLDRPA